MTAETILTDEIISELASKHLSAHAQFVGAGEVHYEGEIAFARALEQAVLQSEQVQAWKRDAERYRWLRDEEDGEGVCVVRIDYWCDEYIGQAHCEVYGGDLLDKAIDDAMEKHHEP